MCAESSPTAAGSRLKGRRIVITGGASGIGRAAVRLFADEGATVILLDRDGAAVRDVLGDARGRCVVADITDFAQTSAAISDAASEFGGIDGVINSAGIMITGPLSDMSLETWRKTIDINLTGSFHVVKACLPHFDLSRGPTIVNIASAAGLLPNAPGVVAYAASKGGVISLSKALAAELAPGIRVNCVCPGMVDTPMAPGNGGNVSNYALKRMADPMEIARALLFLSSSDSSYMTASVVAVDGGRSFH